MKKYFLIVTLFVFSAFVGCKKKTTDPVAPPIICSVDKMWYYTPDDTIVFTGSISGNTYNLMPDHAPWENIHLTYENGKLIRRAFSGYTTPGEEWDISSFYYDVNGKLSVYVHDNDSLIYERISTDSLKAKYYGISGSNPPTDKGYLYFKTDGNGNTLKMYAMPYYTEMSNLPFPKDTIILEREYTYGPNTISSSDPYYRILGLEMGWSEIGENTKLEATETYYRYDSWSGSINISTYYWTTSYQYDSEGRIADIYTISNDVNSHSRFTYTCD